VFNVNIACSGEDILTPVTRNPQKAPVIVFRQSQSSMAALLFTTMIFVESGNHYGIPRPRLLIQKTGNTYPFVSLNQSNICYGRDKKGRIDSPFHSYPVYLPYGRESPDPIR